MTDTFFGGMNLNTLYLLKSKLFFKAIQNYQCFFYYSWLTLFVFHFLYSLTCLQKKKKILKTSNWDKGSNRLYHWHISLEKFPKIWTIKTNQTNAKNDVFKFIDLVTLSEISVSPSKFNGTIHNFPSKLSVKVNWTVREKLIEKELLLPAVFFNNEAVIVEQKNIWLTSGLYWTVTFVLFLIIFLFHGEFTHSESGYYDRQLLLYCERRTRKNKLFGIKMTLMLAIFIRNILHTQDKLQIRSVQVTTQHPVSTETFVACFKIRFIKTPSKS